MHEIAQWLEQLGMAEYVERFVADRIDLSVLRDLTDQDLKDLGFLRAGRGPVDAPRSDTARRHARGTVQARGSWWLPAALLLQGLFLVSLFAAMHECVHSSAFRSRRMNEVVGWLAGLGILFNATYYRQFHFAHHRYAQDPVRDPELLTAPPPRSRSAHSCSAPARSSGPGCSRSCSGSRSCGSTC